MRRLLLWDIDGTLLDFKGASRPAFARAIEQAAGSPVEDHLAVFDGKTDQQIADETLRSMGVSEQDRPLLVRRVVRSLGRCLAEERHQLRLAGVVLPGVRDVLMTLQDYASVNTVLTGNIAVNAVLKLDLFGLASFFDLEVGAFGSDAMQREDLLEISLQRVQQRRGHVFEDEGLWVIGDTPRDLSAARAGHARCLLVATGRHGVEELQSLGADAVMPDLSDTTAVIDLLMN